MRAKQLKILAGATVLALLAAILVLIGENRQGTSSDSETRLLPELSAMANDVTAIQIETTDESLAIERRDGVWVVPEKAGYPAKFDAVKGLIVGFSEARIVEPKTARAENHALLSLVAPGAPYDGDEKEPYATLVTLKTADDTAASLLVGRSNAMPGAGGDERTYVRKPGKNQTWMVAGLPAISVDGDEWIDKDILSIERDRIESATIAHPDGETLTIYRASPEETNFQVKDIPEGRELSYASVPNGPGGALSFINFDDVAPVDTIDFSNVTTATYRTFDGLVVSVDITENGSGTEDGDAVRWARFNAAYTPAPEPAVPAGKNGNEATVVANAPENVEAEAAEIASRLGGWAYRLPDYKVKDFTKRLDDLLKQPEETETGEEEPDQGAL